MIISGLLLIAAAVPYMVNVVRRKTKPRLVSWFTWTVLSILACAASFAEGQIPSGVLMFAAILETGIVLVLGFKYGSRDVEPFDIYCLLGAGAGLGLWVALDAPAVAMLVMVAIDLVGSLPTFRHAWKKPHEETGITYALCGLSGSITLLLVNGWTITGVAYPIYIILVNGGILLFILSSPHRSKKYQQQLADQSDPLS